jgi:hypothetical protein
MRPRSTNEVSRDQPPTQSTRRACVYASLCCPHFEDKRELLLGLAQELARRGVATVFVLAGQDSCPHIIRLRGSVVECGRWFSSLEARARTVIPTEVIGARPDLETEIERHWRDLVNQQPRIWSGHRLDVIAHPSVVRRLAEPTNIASPLDIAAAYERDTLRHLLYYRDVLDRHRPDFAVYFGGSFHQDRTAFLTARERQVPAYAIETAFIPSCIYVDDAGVTGVRGNASRYALLHESESVSPTGEQEAVIDTLMLRSFGTKDPGSVSSVARMRAREHLRVRDEERLVVFLGQVEYDASLTADGLAFRDQRFAIEMLYAALAPYPNVRLIVRPHPKSNQQSSEMRRTASAIGVQVVPASGTETEATLLNTLLASDVAVTVNSQAGLQAAWLGLPVVTLGRASYSGMGFTIDVGGHPQLLPASLGIALDTPLGAGRDAAVGYIYALRRHILADPSPATLADRILGLSLPATRGTFA